MTARFNNTRRIRLFFLVCILGLIIPVATVVTAAGPGEAWKFRSDLPNSGIYDDGGTRPTGSLLWNVTTGSGFNSSPAVVDGTVYVGCDDNKLYAFNAGTGTLLWSYTTGGRVRSSPAVANGVVYIGSDDNNVYALEAETGALLWNYTTDGVVRSSPAVENGVVYVGGNICKISALNATTGALLWNYTAGSGTYQVAFVTSSPAVANGIVYVGNYDRNLYAFNASTGALLWNYTTGDFVFSSPAVGNGIVCFGSWDGNLYALNADTGALAWNFTTGSQVTGSPAITNGVVYFGGGGIDANIYALNAANGAKIWNYTMSNSASSSPAVANGVVYAGSYDNNIYALDEATGALKWKFTTGNDVTSSPAVKNGVVYAGSWDGKFYAIGSVPANPPASITNLHNTTYSSDRITWNWTDPPSANFDHVMIFLDGVFTTNVTKGIQSYSATSLNASTAYTISTHTVGITGLVNQTWVNNTATTSSVPVVAPASITNLHNTTYSPDRITWTWTDPVSPDFDHVMVFLDGVFTTNVTKGMQSYNATGLDASTTYTISTHSVGTTGLVNQTWVNHTATTSPVPVVPPASITNLHNTTYSTDRITWNWTDPVSPDFDHVMVFLDGVFTTNVTKGTQALEVVGLNASTAYTISTHTVGTTGLVNQTWVNNTATTAPVPVVPPASITNLHNTTYLPNKITWAWTDPSSGDFDHVMVFLDGVFKVNVTKGTQSYIAIGLNASTAYTLSTHTVGATGLLNQTWVNHTTTTAPASPVAPASITNLHNTTYQPDLITWNWTDPVSAEFDYVRVYLDGVFQANVTKGTQSYTATGLNASTTYTIATHTIGTTGVVNRTSVNHTATTAPASPVAPASITNLHNTTYQPTMITWAWTDPSSTDFDHVLVYLNGVFQGNVTKGTQTFSTAGLTPAMEYTISTRTAGTTGLVNQTWVNHTATTSAVPSGPGSLYVATFPTGATIFIDGIARGRTDGFVDHIPAGTLNLTLTKGGYAAKTLMVTVPAGLKVLPPITLQPGGGTQGTGTLYVASYPTNAEILIDGENFGQTDGLVYNAPTGIRNLTLEKDGYAPTTVVIQIPEGDLKVLAPITLEPLSSSFPEDED